MSKITRFGTKNNTKKVAQLKSYLGFEYIKLKKDVNGLEFNIEHLLEYSNKNRYKIIYKYFR